MPQSLFEEFVDSDEQKPSARDFMRIFHPMTSVEPDNFARHHRKPSLEETERRRVFA